MYKALEIETENRINLKQQVKQHLVTIKGGQIIIEGSKATLREMARNHFVLV